MLKSYVTLFFIISLFILAVGIGAPEHRAQAMGQAPATCPNLYRAYITNFTIYLQTTQGVEKFDALHNPNFTLTIANGEAYNVSMIFLPDPLSVAGNNSNGSVWYSSNYPGFGDGVCVLNAFGGRTVHTQFQITKPGSMDPQGNDSQNVYWQEDADAAYPVFPVMYSVNWMQGNSSLDSITTNSSTTSTASTSTTTLSTTLSTAQSSTSSLTSSTLSTVTTSSTFSSSASTTRSSTLSSTMTTSSSATSLAANTSTVSTTTTTATVTISISATSTSSASSSASTSSSSSTTTTEAISSSSLIQSSSSVSSLSSSSSSQASSSSTSSHSSTSPVTSSATSSLVSSSPSGSSLQSSSSSQQSSQSQSNSTQSNTTSSLIAQPQAAAPSTMNETVEAGGIIAGVAVAVSAAIYYLQNRRAATG